MQIFRLLPRVVEESRRYKRFIPRASHHGHESKLPLGITALYDKSISLGDIRAAIDEHYGKWAVPDLANSPLRIWRVEPEKFTIQLSIATKKDEKRNIAEAGTKQAIYIAFGGRSACDVP